MIRPDFNKWHQNAEDMLKLATEAPHYRSRERFQALYMIGTNKSNATQWAGKIKRRKQTVLDWVHLYNAQGANALHYQQTGGRQAALSETEKKK